MWHTKVEVFVIALGWFKDLRTNPICWWCVICCLHAPSCSASSLTEPSVRCPWGRLGHGKALDAECAMQRVRHTPL